ncbi:MAG TPA: hypothetical protein VHH88_04815 [Verrucomicrobiae bacterium]|nr:hypothetical protein [Verrucomicrobiae bacterium]
MSEPVPNAELLGSLGRLVRGLSALFWGLPIALIVCVWSANPHWFKSFGVAPGLAATALLVYGVWLLGGFQRQERVWQAARDRALLLGLISFGLSPFLFWFSQIPMNDFFLVMVVLECLSSLLFVGSLNFVLQRLGAMLPDEGLRAEIRQFTALNLNLLFLTLAVSLLWFSLTFFRTLPAWLSSLAKLLENGSFWFLIPLILLPIAMTMALLWKTKEVILDGVFGARR